jgi:hypothetical protein
MSKTHRVRHSSSKETNSESEEESSKRNPSIYSSYKWIGKMVKEDRNHRIYDCMSVKLPNVDLFRVYTGDTVLFHSESSVPYIGLVEQLFEYKANGHRSLRVRWFFRQHDVKALRPRAFDAFPNLTKHDIFYSSLMDINDIRSVLRPCTVIYVSADETNLPMERTMKQDSFICRYRFVDDKVGLMPLNSSEMISLGSTSQMQREELLEGSTMTTRKSSLGMKPRQQEEEEEDESSSSDEDEDSEPAVPNRRRSSASGASNEQVESLLKPLRSSLF